MSDPAEIMTRIITDIDAAKEQILMEFYIWDLGGRADDVSAALVRAAKRGVQCFVLVDDI
jgi:cardiolipin synthase